MDDYSSFTEVPDYPVSDIQGGRGEVNPPMAYEKQPLRPVQRRGGTIGELQRRQGGPAPMVPSREAFFSEAYSNPLLEGAADMITAQGFDYVPAGLAYGVGKLRGDDYSFQEVLNAARKRTQEVRAGSPVGYGLGQAAGLVYGGARMLPAAVKGITPAVTAALPRVFGAGAGGMGTTAAKLAPWIATPAVLGTEGAISGLAQSEGDLSAAAKGAGIGVAAGLLPLAAAAKPITGKFSDMFHTAVTKKMAEADKARPKTRGELRRASKRLAARELDLVDEALNYYGTDTIRKRAWDYSMKEISSAFVPAAIGAIGGAGAAAMAGKDPYEGAYYGSAGTVAATKVKVLGDVGDAAKMTLGRIAAESPTKTAEVIRQFGTTVSKGITDTGTTLSNKKKEVAEDDYSGFTEVQ